MITVFLVRRTSSLKRWFIVKRWQFERLGVFTYSLEPDTPAASDGHLPEDVKGLVVMNSWRCNRPSPTNTRTNRLGKVPCIVDSHRGSETMSGLAEPRLMPDIDCVVTLRHLIQHLDTTRRCNFPVSMVAAAGTLLADDRTPLTRIGLLRGADALLSRSACSHFLLTHCLKNSLSSSRMAEQRAAAYRTRVMSIPVKGLQVLNFI